MRQRSYKFGSSQLAIVFADIVTADAQVIVSSDDSYITMGGGVSAAIRRAGGEAIPLDASKKVPAALGDVIVTTGGALKAQYVFHAITIGANSEGRDTAVIIQRITRRCMRLLDELQLSSIAFPAIGAGSANFTYKEVAAQMAEVIASELSSRTNPAHVSIFLFDSFGATEDLDFVEFFAEFGARVPQLSKMTPSVTAPTPPVAHASIPDLATETQEEYKRRRIYNLRRLLVELEDQRGKLEQRLIALLGGDEPGPEERVRKALADNQELRLQYLNELQTYMAQGPETASEAPRKINPLTVFVSSTSADLKEHRAAIRDALSRCDLFFRGMEHFGASPDGLPPATVIVEAVRKADVYLGIFGMRYGSIDPATGLSMTELEFREAETGKKPMLMYAMHQEATLHASDVETDADGLKKLTALKAHILKQYVPYLFRNVDDLTRQAQLDLAKLKTP